jgi:hypothetical protein
LANCHQILNFAIFSFLYIYIDVESNQDLTYEQQAENQLAHEQNITAFVPGGEAIADLD